VITGIVVALPEELTTLTSKNVKKGNCAFLSDNLVIAYSGTGSANAQAAAELLITQGAIRLMSWGCAAALSATLKPGDLILADKLVDAEGVKDVRFPVCPEWCNYAKNLLSPHALIHTGSLAESEKIVSLSEDKKMVALKTDAIALDMESIAIAKVAGRNNLPFLAIRTIADPLGMDLPKAISRSLNDQGDVVLGKLLRHLACHPAELPGLINMGIYFNAAKKTLKLVAGHLDSIIDFNDNYNQQPV